MKNTFYKNPIDKFGLTVVIFSILTSLYFFGFTFYILYHMIAISPIILFTFLIKYNNRILWLILFISYNIFFIVSIIEFVNSVILINENFPESSYWDYGFTQKQVIIGTTILLLIELLIIIAKPILKTEEK